MPSRWEGFGLTAIEAMKYGAFEYVVKTFDIDEVIDLARRAIEKYDSRGRRQPV